jgi:hypothetical protein
VISSEDAPYFINGKRNGLPPTISFIKVDFNLIKERIIKR